MRVRPVKGVARRHAAHRKELKLARFPAQFHNGFEPIDLRFLSKLVALWHAHQASSEPQFPLAPLHIAPHGWLRDTMFRVFLAQASPDAMRCVPLFPRRVLIGLQDGLYGLLQRL